MHVCVCVDVIYMDGGFVWWKHDCCCCSCYAQLFSFSIWHMKCVSVYFCCICAAHRPVKIIIFLFYCTLFGPDAVLHFLFNYHDTNLTKRRRILSTLCISIVASVSLLHKLNRSFLLLYSSTAILVVVVFEANVQKNARTIHRTE